MGGIISSIDPDSIAEDLNWQPGDEIVSINGHELHDIIDYRFYSSDEFLTVVVRRGSQQAEFEIEKDYDIPLGVNFTDILFDGIRTCGAHCVFCFVEQLPKGLRKSLYLKDDDYRLSFLQGNYVTLGNVTDEDIQRIIFQRLSPLYISVHTTDSILREKMLGRGVPDILNQIDALSAGSITMHTQVVLCRGINDGEYLDQTIYDLASRYPYVASIAIVPAGITAHRRNKTPIGIIDSEYAVEIIKKVEQWQRNFLEEKGSRIVWASDEFYLLAQKRIPSASSYEGFPQIENGVGLVRQFKDKCARARRLLENRLNKKIKLSLVTGELSAPVLREWINSVTNENLEINLYPIQNELFGRTVTVTGLISGRDIINQLSGKVLGDALVIPSVALRENMFLDDVVINEVEKELKCAVLAVNPDPISFARLVITIDKS